jgi:hypothetical protein
MVGKPGLFSRFLAASSGFLVAVSALVMMSEDFLAGLVVSIVFVVIWIGFVRFLAFMSETGELDVSPLLEEIRSESALQALIDKAGRPGEVKPTTNPQRIIGANNRTLVECARDTSSTKRSQRREPDPEAEDDRAWAEMMRVL